jgi:hypothetical protein
MHSNITSSFMACIGTAFAGMTSSDGKCHTFDASANGYSRGEGCGAIVMKRMDDAIASKDGIYAVIRGSAVMQDGKSASLTAPNGLAQEALLAAALQEAQVRPEEVSFLEAHGTGTKLGDPIETAALAAVYGRARSPDNPLYVSSVKANVGHLEAGAGMVGLLSVISALQNRQAPPNVHLSVLNEKIAQSVEGCNFVFPTTCVSMDAAVEGASRRRLLAGLSSFGYSGTIAHMIVEEAPAENRRVPRSAAVAGEHEDKELVAPQSLYHDFSAGEDFPLCHEVQNDMMSGDMVVKSYLHRGVLADWLGDHVVNDSIVFPGAALMELSLSAYRRCRSRGSAALDSQQVKYSIDDFILHRPVMVRDVRKQRSEKCTVLMCVVGVDGHVSIYGEDRDDQGDRYLHAEALVSKGDSDIRDALHP